MTRVAIDVRHVTRVEGHGNLRVNIKDGEITRLELAIVESPRFFESFLRGRRYDEVPHITCRICGICSVGHTITSLKAVEAALGITPTEQTILLRKLILCGEHIQSHILHLYFLAVPDYLGVGSVIPIAKTHPEVVQRALRLKKLANDLCGAVGGRHVHPIALHVGGMAHVPTKEELAALKTRLVNARGDLEQTVALWSSLPTLGLRRDTEYLSLKASNRDEYALYDGDLVSTLDPRPTNPSDFRRRVIEDVVSHSTAKHCRSPNSPTYVVGALARFNNNHAWLHPAARAAAERLGLTAVCDNPFHNNTAQLVETVHCVETAITLIDQLLAWNLKVEPLVPPAEFGAGVGAVEVPRGVLFHEFGFDGRGRVEHANLIIPTGQNLANIEEDLRALARALVKEQMEKDAMTLQLEMLVRAYDPCISCATHYLDIEWD